MAAAAAIKPGVIPLRPLTLTDILNGAFSYIRTNPKATLGLTTVVVVIAQLIALVLQIGPFAAMGELGVLRGDEASTAAALGSSASGIASTVTTLLSSVLLSGMLTVIVGRAVFGAGITIGEAWQRVRGRLLPLIGYTLLWLLGGARPRRVVVVVVAVAATLSGGGIRPRHPARARVDRPARLPVDDAEFRSPLIVLERLGHLFRRSSGRCAGEGRLLAGPRDPAVGHDRRRRRRRGGGIPFSLTGQILLLGSESTTTI